MHKELVKDIRSGSARCLTAGQTRALCGSKVTAGWARAFYRAVFCFVALGLLARLGYPDACVFFITDPRFCTERRVNLICGRRELLNANDDTMFLETATRISLSWSWRQELCKLLTCRTR
jgi:hypothetical protein